MIDDKRVTDVLSGIIEILNFGIQNGVGPNITMIGYHESSNEQEIEIEVDFPEGKRNFFIKVGKHSNCLRPLIAN